MAITKCPECGGKVSDAADACPHCGYPLKRANVAEPMPRKKHTGAKIAAAVAAVAVAAMAWAVLAGPLGYLTRNGVYANLYQAEGYGEYVAFTSNGRTLKTATIDGRQYGLEQIAGPLDVAWANYSSESKPQWTDAQAAEFVDKVAPASLAGWFAGCGNLTTVAGLDKVDLSKVSDMSSMFSGCESLAAMDFSWLKVKNPTNMDRMFRHCYSLKSADLSGIGSLGATNLFCFFEGCESLEAVDMSGLDISRAESVAYMLLQCNSLTDIDLSNADITNAWDMSGLLNGCSSLTAVDLSTVRMPNVTHMGGMFRGCTSLRRIELPEDVILKPEDSSLMFADCDALTSLDLSSLDTSSDKNMRYMFGSSENLIEIRYGSAFVKTDGCDDVAIFNGCPANRPPDPSWG